MMREGWTYKKLGEVTHQISDGSHNPPKGIDYSEYPMLSSKNIYFDGYNYESPRYLSKDEFEIENKRTNISDGDVLLTIVGTVGRTCCVKKPFVPFTLQRSVAVLKPQKSIILSRFLMYALHSLSDLWEKEAKGVAQKGIYLKQLSSIPIPIPPLSEQERIVAELDLLSILIEKQKEQLKDYDTLAQSLFYDMFGTSIEEKGWEIRTLGEIGTFERGGGFLKSDFVDNGFPCIHYGQIHTKFGKFIQTHLTSISEDLALSKSKIAHQGDVIIAITSEDVEGSCKCTAWLGGYDVAVGAHAAIFRHTLNPIYVSYYFSSTYYSQAKTRYAHGFKVVEIKPTDIAKISICIPPLSLQESFAKQVEAIEEQKRHITETIADTQRLFDYTMDKYFG